MSTTTEKEEPTGGNRTAHPFQMIQEGLVHAAESCSSHQSSTLLLSSHLCSSPCQALLPLLLPSPRRRVLPGEPLFPASSTPWVSSSWSQNASSRNWWSSSAKNLLKNMHEPSAESLEPLSQITSLKGIVLISIILLTLAKNISPLSTCERRKEKRNLDPPEVLVFVC